jgi:5-oxoprolinase (ATP-hydrolysing)
MPLRALSFILDLPVLHRITDVEIMERRYPVILHRFGLREGSGGDGLHHGGEGVIREVEVSTRNIFLTLISSDAYDHSIQFLEDMQVSILSERRVHRPYGMAGGEPAQPGRNVWVKLPREREFDLVKGKENPPRRINLGGKQSVNMGAGDRIEMYVTEEWIWLRLTLINRLRRHTPGGGGYGIKGGERKVNGYVPQWESRGSLADRQSATHAA